MGSSAGALLWLQVARSAGRDTCARKARCQAVRECECIVVDGLGQYALERAVVWMKAQPLKHIANLLDFGRAFHLGWVAEQVVAWGIAPVKRAA
jgi:hypothetical protein